MADDIPVQFVCRKDGEEKDCTPNAVASLRSLLDERPRPFYAGIFKVTAGAPPTTWDLCNLKLTLATKGLLGEGKLRLLVDCPACDGQFVLTDRLVKEAKPDPDNPARATIELVPLTPTDKALVKATEEMAGSGALKASMGTAALVVANVALITSVVTTLGLVKSEEIGSKLTGWKLVPLLAAVLAGAAAILTALWAQAVSSKRLHADNLAEVRDFVDEQAGSRKNLSIASLALLTAAAALVTGAFVWLAVEDAVEDKTPTATLSVSAVGAAGVDAQASWSDAENGEVAVLAISVDGTPLESTQATIAGGSAKLAGSVTATAPQTGEAVVRVLTRLLPEGSTDLLGGEAIAEREQCVLVSPAGPPELADCPA